MRPVHHLAAVCWFSALGSSLLPAQTATGRYAPPGFTEPQRRQQVEAVLPEIDRRFRELAAEKHLPGLVYGIVLDGGLVHAKALGFANVERQLPAATDTRFRIASMTKSFVAMAALQLRDAGKLRLDDPVADHVPEFRAVRAPTDDAPPITIEHLITMTAGLPEDNPWGDRQMAITRAAVDHFVGAGLSFSDPPGLTFEYSNLGYVLLGRVVTNAAGVRFQDHVTERILRPLGMRDTVWEYTEVPADKFATGYRREHGVWHAEPILPDGDGAAMGGLITTLDDYARYLAFHLAAWPSRDGEDTGPVRRATVREMHLPRVFSGAAPKATLLDGTTPNPSVTFYGYGLAWNRDSRGVVRISHSGGLPGYGSIQRFCPEHGVGVVAFTNLRYGPVYEAANEALNLLLERGRLQRRTVATSAILATRKQQVVTMLRSWDEALVTSVTAENFLLDRALPDWVALAQARLAAIGADGDAEFDVGDLVPQNQLRGTFTISGPKGRLAVSFTLTPEAVPKVQELDLVLVESK
jgi:CubicO group peptidase (beta-lactamase class C family)